MKQIQDLTATETGYSLALALNLLSSEAHRQTRTDFVVVLTADEEIFINALLKKVIAADMPAAEDPELTGYVEAFQGALHRRSVKLVEHALKEFHQGHEAAHQDFLSGLAHLTPGAAQVILTAQENYLAAWIAQQEAGAMEQDAMGDHQSRPGDL